MQVVVPEVLEQAMRSTSSSTSVPCTCTGDRMSLMQVVALELSRAEEALGQLCQHAMHVH